MEHVWKDPRGRSVPALSADQMREVDRTMVEELGVDLIQMMEHAGRHLAHVARERFVHGRLSGTRVVVLAGTGANGGGALVAGRRLHGWGARVLALTTAEREAYRGVPARQLDILARLDVPVVSWNDATGLRTPEMVLDGIIGYGLNGPLRGSAPAMIAWANRVAAPVVSLDVPSGLDPTMGTPSEPTVVAAATVTLALPKTGFSNPQARAYLGELYLGDIGVPSGLYTGFNLGRDVAALFTTDDVIRLR